MHVHGGCLAVLGRAWPCLAALGRNRGGSAMASAESAPLVLAVPAALQSARLATMKYLPTANYLVCNRHR